MKKYIAEMIGTLVLVLLGTGVAVVSGGNIIATSFAFGLAIVAMAYSVGNVSGCHVNPAVSLAMVINKKMPKEDFAWYVVFQVLGAIAGTTILYTILSNTDLGTAALGANYYGELSAVNTTLFGAILTEVVLTCVFVYTILGVTSDKNNSAIAGIVIGLTLTFVHLMGIRLTGTSVNPARSIAPAVFEGGEALSQLWAFIVGPFAGAALAAVVWNCIAGCCKNED